MGRRRKPSQARSSIVLEVTKEPYYLTKEEDDERIRRLAKKILACIKKKSEKRDESGSQIDALLGIERDDIFGD